MINKTIGSLYTNNSTDGKWIIDEFRDLVEIPNTDIPVQYHPTTGDCLGVLCEPPSKNYFPDAMSMDGGMVLTDGVFLSGTAGANSVLFFPQGLYFDGTKNERFGSKTATFTFDSPKAWFYVGISFFVRFPNDSQPPVYGRSYIEGSDFHIMINGLEAIEASGDVTIDEMKDGSYWVRARVKTPVRPVYDISIGNSFWQTDRDFIIAGLQIEPYMCTSPILTEGTAKERDGNHITFNAIRGQTINPQQGTIEIGYNLYHGSAGCALYAYSPTQTWEIGHIGDWQDNHEDEEVSYSIRVDSGTEGYSFRCVNDQESFNVKDWKTDHDIRFTFSPYGNRFTTNDSLVYKSKDFNYNESLDSPTTFLLGRSESGENINGHIRYFNIRGRALTDEEMIQ